MTDAPTSIKDLEKCLAEGSDLDLLAGLADRIHKAKQITERDPYAPEPRIIHNLGELDISSIRDLIMELYSNWNYCGTTNGPLPFIDFCERNNPYTHYGQVLEGAYLLGDDKFRLKMIKSAAAVLSQLKESEPIKLQFPLYFYRGISDFISVCKITRFMTQDIIDIVNTGKFKEIERDENGIDAAAMIAIPLFGQSIPSLEWWNSKFGQVPACTVFYGLWHHPNTDRSQLLCRLGDFVERGLTYEQLRIVLHKETCQEFSEQINAGLRTIKDTRTRTEFANNLNKKYSGISTN